MGVAVRERSRRGLSAKAKTMPLEEHPISRIEWVDVWRLSANDYNPNLVQKAEMRLLETSLLSSGWIQPILVTQDYVIIDGFHRSTLARTSDKVQELTGGRVPVCIMHIDEAHRKMLTIRINRAKGSHLAFRMADVVKSLINEEGLTIQEVMQGIGASQHEVELLMQDDVFKKLDIANHDYSKAWYPK